MSGTKVFVGNLSFKTTEAGLAEEFAKAGKVVSANIITRGSRSLGYGFVELENEEVAKKAVQLLNKKELDGRPINVEVANLRDKTEEKPTDAQNTSPSADSGRGRGRGFRGGRGSPRGGRGSPRGRGRGGLGRGSSGGKSEDNQTSPRTPSKTSLFVANLPFSFNDAKLTELVNGTGVNCKFARVVTLQNGRSKGYGFVELDNEDAQKKALDALNDKEVEGRKLAVKIALTEPPKADEKTEVAQN